MTKIFDFVPLLRQRTIILGTGPMATDLCRVLLREGKYSYHVLGFVDKDPSRVGEKLVNPGIVGTLDGLYQIVEQRAVQTIVVCFEDRREILPMDSLLDFKAMGLHVVDGTKLYEEKSGQLSIDFVRPSSLIFSGGFKKRALVMMLKRTIDLLSSFIGLMALLPMFGLIGLMIKLDSPGNIFYRQLRVGLRGHPFFIWKFRSMYKDSEKSGPAWASARDPRVSRVGRWMRTWRIDELPQLLNVVKGEMSLVGPRPERPFFVQELRQTIPYYDLRHTVRPGITGWAQTRFRYGASAEDAKMKMRFDLYYVKNLALWLDFRILVETIRVALFGVGAR